MKPYKAKSLLGAQAFVRLLLKQRAETGKLLLRFDAERKMLARLAAKTPQFSNPLEAWDAEKVRDEILREMQSWPPPTQHRQVSR